MSLQLLFASIDKGKRGLAGQKCPHTSSKPLRIHKVFSAVFSLSGGHFCSRKTASHRTALDFRGIFVLLEAGGLSPANDKRAKSSEKAGCPTCLPLLIDAYLSLYRTGGRFQSHKVKKSRDLVGIHQIKQSVFLLALIRKLLCL